MTITELSGGERFTNEFRDLSLIYDIRFVEPPRPKIKKYYCQTATAWKKENFELREIVNNKAKHLPFMGTVLHDVKNNDDILHISIHYPRGKPMFDVLSQDVAKFYEDQLASNEISRVLIAGDFNQGPDIVCEQFDNFSASINDNSFKTNNLKPIDNILFCDSYSQKFSPKVMKKKESMFSHLPLASTLFYQP